MTEWINCNEQLPCEYHWVLITYIDEHNMRYIPSIAQLRNGKWYTKENTIISLYNNDNKFNNKYTSTHWMELPSFNTCELT